MPRSNWRCSKRKARSHDRNDCNTNRRNGRSGADGDDPDTPEDEGAQAGDVITFTINGKPAQVSGKAVWQERGRQEVRLTSSSCGPHNYLPTIQ